MMEVVNCPVQRYTEYRIIENKIMLSILTVIQVIFATVLICEILLQQSDSGLGAAFGGTGGVQHTKRGLDKILFQATIVTSILFFGISLLKVVI
jgi:protein translocase SecG subunit